MNSREKSGLSTVSYFAIQNIGSKVCWLLAERKAEHDILKFSIFNLQFSVNFQ